MVLESLILLISGTGVGILAGLFGVGGSFLLVPLLSILTSFPIETLVGSCACHVLGPATATSIASPLRRRDLRVPVILVGGIVVGTVAGSDLLEWLQQKSPTAAESVIRQCYLAFFWILGLFSWIESSLHRNGKLIPIGWLTLPFLKPVYCVMGRNREHRVSVISLSLFGWVVGFLSGLLGLGGGVLLLPGLHYFYGIPTKRSAQMSVFLVWIIAFQATIIHGIYHRIDLGMVGLLLVGSTVGAKVGAQMAQRMTGGAIREQFAWMLLGSGALLTVHFLWQLLA